MPHHPSASVSGRRAVSLLQRGYLPWVFHTSCTAPGEKPIDD